MGVQATGPNRIDAAALRTWLLARMDMLGRSWRGPLLAALVVLAAALPGLVALPALDRDEARFAQASAQMLETGDFVNIRLQDEARDKKPVGIHWLQAASVRLVSSVEKREIWAYRIPSILGAMLAAAACAWGASAFLGGRSGLIAGSILGATLLLSTEAGIAKTDAVQCGAIALSMAALSRLYLAAREGRAATPRTRLWFWLGLALAMLVKGPIGPMVIGLTLVALAVADRRGAWIARLGWSWGLVLVVAVVGPWAVAITVATDGQFWGQALGGDLAPKLAGGHESHGAPPGLHLILSPLLLFPAGLILPAALAYGWRHRKETYARFALAWLVPTWLVFEILPTKLAHYPLPVYAALAWLAAGALTQPIGPWSRRIGAVLSVVAGIALAAGGLWAAAEHGGPLSGLFGVAAAALMAASGIAGAVWLTRGHAGAALGLAGVLGVASHMVLGGLLAPSLDDLWLSSRAATALRDAGIDPRNGVTPGPVAAAGFSEPSLVFNLGTETHLGDGVSAAQAVAQGQPALVETRQESAFLAALKALGGRAEKVEDVAGYDYSDGEAATLGVWRSLSDPSHDQTISGPRLP